MSAPDQAVQVRFIGPHARPLGRSVITFICFSASMAIAIFCEPVRLAWILVALCMVTYFLFLGHWICGRALGVFIMERNLMSLSRFQMAAWTILILSAFLTVALRRLHNLNGVPGASPLNIAIDWQIWALMGISASSLVGTPLLLSNKAAMDAPKSVIDKAAETLNEPAQQITQDSQGSLYANASIADAAITDMFQGDDIGNTAYIDVSKLQMFYFTVIAVIAYAYALYTSLGALNDPAKFVFPVPSDGLIALLGISHAAYLTGKVTNHN
jgi:hypothetical protein